MRVARLSAVFLLLSMGPVDVAGADEGPTADAVVPPNARIRLEADRVHAYLGENVIVRYVVENAGDEPFRIESGFDGRAVRPVRTIVRVHDEGGELIEDPWPDPWCFGGPGGPVEVTMSTPFVLEVAVPRYRHFVAPGRYRVRVLHDLGWNEGWRHVGQHMWSRVEEPADDDPRWAETTLVLHEPPPGRIDAILDAMKALPRRGDRSLWRRNPAWSDFETIRHPAYLDALVRRARDRGSHEPDWLEGIRSIETPEATKALIQLLEEDTSEQRAAALLDRLPPVEARELLIDQASNVGPRRRGRASEGPPPGVWQEAFADPVRDWARGHLGGRYAGRMPHHAAYALASVGRPEDMPALQDGLDQALQYIEAEPRRWKDGLERGRLAHLYQAVVSLYRRGAKPPEETGRPVDDALALLWIHARGEEALASYLDRVAAWVGHQQLPIRDLALRALPRPLPATVVEQLGSLLDAQDAELRLTVLHAIAESPDPRLLPAALAQLERADEHRWMHAAEAAAAALGAGRVDRARIHAHALSKESTFRDRLSFLLPLLGRFAWGSSGVPGAEERQRLSAAWSTFLHEHAEAVDAGDEFDVTDARFRPLIPSTVEIR